MTANKSKREREGVPQEETGGLSRPSSSAGNAACKFRVTPVDWSLGDACARSETWDERVTLKSSPSCIPCLPVETKMKLAIALVGVSVVVMGVLIFQVVHQEFRLSHLKVRLVENSAQITRKEEGIVELKAKISELQKSLDDINTKVETLKKKKAEIEKSSEDAGKGLTACTTEKARLAGAHTHTIAL